MPVRKEENGRELTLQQNTNALGGKCSLILNKCKKNCCFITMCKAHSKVTHIKQQKKGRGYNKNSVLYPGRFR